MWSGRGCRSVEEGVGRVCVAGGRAMEVWRNSVYDVLEVYVFMYVC